MSKFAFKKNPNMIKIGPGDWWSSGAMASKAGGVAARAVTNRSPAYGDLPVKPQKSPKPREDKNLGGAGDE